MILDELGSPVILAPLGGGPSTPELAAAVSDVGGLGFVPAGYLKAAEVAARHSAARALTSQPLGVNLFVPGAPAEPAVYRSYVERFRDWAERRQVQVGDPRWDDDDWEAKIDVLTATPPEVVSFTFGCPSSSLIGQLHSRGSEVWLTVTSPDEARQAEQAGADVLVVQGAEAGGHRGSFINGPDLPVYGLLPLLDLVSAAVPLP